MNDVQTVDQHTYNLNYRGQIRGLSGLGSSVIFGTEHPEGQPTGIYRFDLANRSLDVTELDCGVSAQVLVDQTLWIACTDGTIRAGKLGSQPSVVATIPEHRVTGLAPVEGGIAAIAAEQLWTITDAATAIPLEARARSIAAAPDGQRVVVGTTRGELIVFELTDEGFVETNRERLHDGEVTALAFAPDELRVYSTASDSRLLVSFVRGSFDPQDRGGKSMHEKPALAIHMGPDITTSDGTNPRFFTAGLDSSIKSWPRSRSGSQRPASCTTGVVQTELLTALTLDKGPCIVAAGRDGSIRVFEIDENGHASDRVALINDAYAMALHTLASGKPAAREQALLALKGHADKTALAHLADHLNRESDHRVLVAGVEALGTTRHKSTAEHLEGLFYHDVSDVRTAAFDHLIELDGVDVDAILRNAIDKGFEDLGLRCVAWIRETAASRHTPILKGLLDHGEPSVRFDALRALEERHGDQPEGTLLGLASSHVDVRLEAILHLLRRRFLGQPAVDARLRRLWDDPESRVRLRAFIVAMHRRPNLVKALRASDDEFHRHVFDLEESDKPTDARRTEVPAASSFDATSLKEHDFRPLLEAMGSRSNDICLRGSVALAGLGDERAIGTLLQLSRVHDPTARVAVTWALGNLGDPRAIRRVRAMLHDDDPRVRDAAFSALARLEDNDLEPVRAGFGAPHADVRQRALAQLINALREGADFDDDARKLILIALNDSERSIRLETFKSMRNLESQDSPVETLRFVMQSSFSDVRNEVLQEAKAHPESEPHRELLLDLIDDEDAQTCREAFEFALERWPSSARDGILRAGLSSRHASQRIATIEEIASTRDAPRDFIVDALDDDALDVRLSAVNALIREEDRALLARLLKTPHLDVRIEVAGALAKLGDDRCLSVLDTVGSRYLERKKDDRESDELRQLNAVIDSVIAAYDALGSPRAWPMIRRFIALDDPNLRRQAASTLSSIATPEILDEIRTLMRDDEPYVRQMAALALAYNADPGARRLIDELEEGSQLRASLGLREFYPEDLINFVDSQNSRISILALGILVCLEITEHTRVKVPERSLALLSSSRSSVRLEAARALEHYTDQPRFYSWAYSILNDLKPVDTWSASPRDLLLLSRAIALGDARIAVRAANVLETLLLSGVRKDFERDLARFEQRYSKVLEVLEQKANAPAPEADSPTQRIAAAWRLIKARVRSLSVTPQTTEEALCAVAFGAYVGLARHVQVDAQPHDFGATPATRQKAISGLVRLSERYPDLADDARAVLRVSIGDPSQQVRQHAFDALRALTTDEESLAIEALSTPYPDMGSRGLDLLAEGSKGIDLLRESVINNVDGLEVEAAKLLADRTSWTHVYTVGLNASSESLRRKSVLGLAEGYDDPDAANALRDALDSNLDDVRFLAAKELANRKDRCAFDTLIAMVENTNVSVQSTALEALETLGDPRTPAALVSCVRSGQDDLNVNRCLEAAARFGDHEIAPDLLEMIDDDLHRSPAFDAVVELSGYRQYQWSNDDEVTPEWEASLNPRHPDIFAKAFELAYRISDEARLGKLVGLSKWPPEHARIDAILAALSTISHDSVRHRAVEMIGWRLRHRDGPAEPLHDALEGDDILDQFYAAEGLALAGNSAGLPVLRTVIDAFDDHDLRRRAVLAIGVLAEPSTLELLLDFAHDDTHILQEPAAEAIGHMSHSERAEEIFSTLERLALDYRTEVKAAALKGLRWFDTPDAWKVLRRHARSNSWWVATRAVGLLRHDRESQPVIEEVLRNNEDSDVADSAIESLRHILGPDSLEPDYLALQSSASYIGGFDEIVSRIRDDGDAERILDLMSQIPESRIDDVVPRLVTILLGRDPLPVEAAATMLDDSDPRAAEVAAQIIGRAGPTLEAPQQGALESALKSTRESWRKAFDDTLANRRGAAKRLETLTPPYQKMLWAAGQTQVASAEILAAADLPGHPRSAALRREAVANLGDPWIADDGIPALLEIARGMDPELRSMAAAELSRCAPERCAESVDNAGHDSVSIGRLVRMLPDQQAVDSMRKSVEPNAHIALPKLAALGDVEGLFEAARNASLDATIRHGAIDALGTLSKADAAERLAEFASNEDEDEALRKAAWRARRRVHRRIDAHNARQEAP